MEILFAINFSATRLYRQLQAEKARNDGLEARLITFRASKVPPEIFVFSQHYQSQSECRPRADRISRLWAWKPSYRTESEARST